MTTAISGSAGGTFEVKLHRAADGNEIFSRTFPFDGVAIPGHVRDSAIAAQEERLVYPAQRRAFDSEAKSRIPPVYAPVQAILIGRDGRVWVGLRQTSLGNPWLILGAMGEPAGRVIVPGNVTLHVADADYAWGLERDEMEIESVVRYRLPHAVEP